MRKMLSNVFIIITLFICSMLFVSCDAITAQNIKNTDLMPGMNGNQGMNRGPGAGRQGNAGNTGMPGNQGRNGKQGMNSNGNLMGGTMNANLIGKIISIDGNSIKIELIEQIHNDEVSNSNDEKQDIKNNQNNDNNNKQSSKGFSGGMPEMNYTGVEKILIINDDVNISQGSNMGRQNQNDNSKATIKVSDLKKDQIIGIWYKENTEAVEKISIMQ